MNNEAVEYPYTKSVHTGNYRKDLHGLRFGQLRVISELSQRRNGIQWECECVCGNKAIFTSQQLISGSKTHCGCGRPTITGMVYRIIEEGKQEDIESSKLKKKRSNLTGRTIIDKQGQKFGKLTIIEECDTPTFPGKVTWKCECDCGTIVSRTNSQLKKVKEQHCGCGKPKKPRNPRVPGIPKKDTTKSEQKRRHLQYLRRSKDKGYDFDLTEKEFYEKLELPCHYCGQPPTDNRTMTLDRVDNNRGYTIDNIVPACTWCNRAKNSLSTGDFLEQVSLIYHQHCRE